MPTYKIAITIDSDLLGDVDRLVKEARFPNRSIAIQEAVREKLSRLKRTRLAEECAKLDPVFEKKLADEGLASDAEQWPKE